MLQIQRHISTKIWVRIACYGFILSLAGGSLYVNHVSSKEADRLEVVARQSEASLVIQKQAYAALKRVQEAQARLTPSVGSAGTIDATLATITTYLSQGNYNDALALANSLELSIASSLDEEQTAAARLEEEALKSGILTLNIPGASDAEVRVLSGETLAFSGKLDQNGSLTTTLPVGTYSLSVVAVGFIEQKSEIQIVGKATTSPSIALTPTPKPTTSSSTPKTTPKPTAKATPKAETPPAQSSTEHSSYRRTTLATSRGNFTADIMEFQLGAGKIKVITDTAGDGDCTANCPTLPVKSFAQRHSGAIAAINGTYFCAADYASCSNEKGSFFWKIYNTRLSRMMNPDNYLGEEDPFLIFDQVGNPTFLSTWSSLGNRSIVAGINHKPAVVRNGAYSVNEGTLDDKQRTAKVSRAAIGVKGSTLYVAVIQAATIMDLGAAMVSLNVDNALNLDGGGSTAMYYGDQYKRGPGRSVPNAIVFVQQ